MAATDRDRKPAQVDMESALSTVGLGRLHAAVAACSGLACGSSSLDVMSVSFVLPAAECELRLSSPEKGLLQSSLFAGMLLGGLAAGAVGDVGGRRRAMLLSLSLLSGAALASAAAPSFLVFLGLRFLSGVGSGAALPVAFAYFSEWQPPGVRATAVAGLSCCWMLGSLLAACLAWALLPHPDWLLTVAGASVRVWRLFLAVGCLPPAAALCLLLRLPESPKLLLQRGESEKATAMMNRLAVRYGKVAHHETAFDAITVSCDVLQLKEDEENEEENEEKNEAERNENEEGKQQQQQQQQHAAAGGAREASRSLLRLFSSGNRRAAATLVLCTSCFAFGYYGLLLWFPLLFKRAEQHGGSVCHAAGSNETEEMHGMCDFRVLASTKPYTEGLAVTAANLPGNVAALLLVSKVDSRWLLSVSLLVSSASVLLVAMATRHWQSLVLGVVFVGVSSVGWSSLNVLQTELLPTPVRATSIGLAGAASRLASVAANAAVGWLIDRGCLLPMAALAAAMAAAAGAACCFPAARGRR